MTDTMPVRTGTPEDIDFMMELALSACEENGFVEPNPAKLLNELWAALTLESGVVGIIGKVGENLKVPYFYEL